MLNKKKKIIDTTPLIKDKNQSFLDLPILPKNVIINPFLSYKVSKKLPFVFQKSNNKNLTFVFSGKKYRDQYFFQLYKKDIIDLHDSYTKKVVILNKIFKAKKTFKSFLLKTVRGGFMTTSVGLISFVPKSLKSKLPKHKNYQKIIQFKLFRNNKNFSFKQNFKINIVSSLKN
jgi:hypothetical protein|tara:strand:- start:325 stop:843 length:519 start_codon:yes stop_codon:yes gene_type:complete